MIRLFALLASFMLAHHMEAQYKLIVTKEPQAGIRTIELGPGTRVDLSYFKSVTDTATRYSKTNLSSTSGRIKAVLRDTVILKRFLSKKELFIPTNSIFQLRKSTNLLVFSGITSGTIVSGYFLSEATGYFLPAPLQWALPALIYVYLDNKVINPMKIVHERFYTNKNQWVLSLEPSVED